MTSITPEEYAEKWNRRIKASTPDIQKGVERVTVNPASLAIAKKDKMRTNTLKAIDDGTWEAGLRKVTLEDWRQAFLTKGIGRISAGADGAMFKMQDFGAWVMARHATIGAKIKAMPDVTLEDNINRMTTYIREMAKEKYKK